MLVAQSPAEQGLEGAYLTVFAFYQDCRNDDFARNTHFYSGDRIYSDVARQRCLLRETIFLKHRCDHLPTVGIKNVSFQRKN